MKKKEWEVDTLIINNSKKSLSIWWNITRKDEIFTVVGIKPNLTSFWYKITVTKE